MRILDTFNTGPDVALRLRTRATDNVLAYAAFLKHIPTGSMVAEWPAGVLESDDGGNAMLTDPSGYALTIVPIIATGDPAVFQIDLTLNGQPGWTEPVPAPPQKTFGWIFIV